MNVDYIIVGAGLAGLSFAEFCLRNNKSFIVFDDDSRSSSKIAGGMFNPVVLKRFTSIWEADAQVIFADKFYSEVEDRLEQKFYFQSPIFRKFASIEEQNNWFVACDNIQTSRYLNPILFSETLLHIPSDYKFGEVFNCGFLDVSNFVITYQNHLKKNNLFIKESFEYNDLIFNDEYVLYHNIQAKKIIFAEGFSIHKNPFFNFLPVDGTKGELLIVRIPDLKLDKIVKSSVFIIPLGNDLYKVGATYNWQDKSDVPTKDALEEIIKGLEGLIDCSYEIVQHLAGIRPTVNDRRPLIGAHYIHKKAYILNGLGTRGVLLGPYLAQKLFYHIENGDTLDHNINVERYYKKLQLIK